MTDRNVRLERVEHRVTSLERRVWALEHGRHKEAREFIVRRIVDHARKRGGFLVAVLPQRAEGVRPAAAKPLGKEAI
jgi:hypothetical protein